MTGDDVTAMRAGYAAGVGRLTVVLGSRVTDDGAAAGEFHWWIVGADLLHDGAILELALGQVPLDERRPFLERHLLMRTFISVDRQLRRTGQATAWDPRALEPWPVHMAVNALALYPDARAALNALAERSQFPELRTLVRGACLPVARMASFPHCRARSDDGD